MWSLMGSPPRVRGEGICLDRHRPRLRITPACAGRSVKHHGQIFVCQDHPRVCGEKRGSTSCLVTTPGSPPRVRGEDTSQSVVKARNRITPACAGRRGYIPVGSAITRDHPRVCGEKRSLVFPRLSTGGSPPRVRGEVDPEILVFYHDGITPACAGRSGAGRAGAGGHQDHPRVCGEKEQIFLDRYHNSGSPPRVRGEDAVQPRNSLEVRITPACAGRSLAFLK